MASLIDVNVLVALFHGNHFHSQRAVEWLAKQQAESVLVCRTAQMGALRVLTKPSIMKIDLFSTTRFWELWDQLLKEDDRFVFVHEPKSLESVWQQITKRIPHGECAETDAYLAAFAQAGGWTLVSFDRGLSRFRKTKTHILI